MSIDAAFISVFLLILVAPVVAVLVADLLRR